ncbi:GRAM domain-containing protein 2, partial [Myotis brandtii]
NQQMHRKMTSLKSPLFCTEKLVRVQTTPDSSLHWPEGLKGEEIKKYSREGTLLSKYNQQYHKLFKDIPLEEVVLKVCSCALQRDLLLQGRLYISPNWLCFHASLFGKDIKVVMSGKSCHSPVRSLPSPGKREAPALRACLESHLSSCMLVVIPVVSVQMVKKHKMARLLPNGLAITTNTSQKYVFVSLLSRDSVYDMLRRVCTHLQPSSKKSLSVREFSEEPECESLEVLTPEMKWRKICPASRSLSLPDSIPCIPPASMDSPDSFFSSRKPPGSGKAKSPSSFREQQEVGMPHAELGSCCPRKMTNCSLIAENAVCEEETLEEEPRSSEELRLWNYQLLKVFFVL